MIYDVFSDGCYYFCLTRGPGEYQFVTCKRLYPSGGGFPVCLCLITSRYVFFSVFLLLLYVVSRERRLTAVLLCSNLFFRPWFELFESLLDRIATTFAQHLSQFVNMQELISYLDVLLACRPPESGRVSLTLPTPGLLVPNDTPFSFEVPQDDRQFGCPPLPLFLKPLSPSKLLHVFAALLMERRIIVHSNRVDRLTHFMFGLTALLFPLEWPHPFTPILCARGLGYCAATFPFLFGIHTSLIPQVMEQALESITWVNLDTGSISNPEDDAQLLRPQSLFNRLSSAIETERSKISKKSYRSNGDALWNPFISFWSSVLVPSLKALRGSPGQEFDEQCFLNSFEVTMRPLAKHIMQSQMFQQYIDERQHWTKEGTNPKRQFDLCAARLSTIHSSIMLQAYFDSISQHGLGVISNALVPTQTQTQASTTPRSSSSSISNSSPPIATFSSALDPPKTDSASQGDQSNRQLPRRPTLRARPHSGSMQDKSLLGNNWAGTESTRILFSNSVSSSSYAPSSSSSFESGPPSCESDLLQLDLMGLGTTPGSSSSSIFSFSPTNKPRATDRVGATALLANVQKPWESRSPSGSLSSGTPSLISPGIDVDNDVQREHVNDMSSSVPATDWFPSSLPPTPMEPTLSSSFSASDLRSDLPKKPSSQKTISPNETLPSLHFGLTPGDLRSDLDTLAHL